MKFIQILTLAISVNLIFFFLWIYILSYNDLVSDEYLNDSLTQIIRGIIWGIIIGLFIGFLELLPKYVKKQWDLHIVVPSFLVLHLSISIIINIGQFFVPSYESLEKIGFGLGFVIGGLIAIIAYIGEIKLEHREKDANENPALNDAV